MYPSSNQSLIMWHHVKMNRFGKQQRARRGKWIATWSPLKSRNAVISTRFVQSYSRCFGNQFISERIDWRAVYMPFAVCRRQQFPDSMEWQFMKYAIVTQKHDMPKETKRWHNITAMNCNWMEYHWRIIHSAQAFVTATLCGWNSETNCK